MARCKNCGQEKIWIGDHWSCPNLTCDLEHPGFHSSYGGGYHGGYRPPSYYTHYESMHTKPCKKCGGKVYYKLSWSHPPNYCKTCKAGFSNDSDDDATKPCDKCSGTGRNGECSFCGGAGTVIDITVGYDVTCTRCNGSGVASGICQWCGGTGRLPNKPGY